jgi:sporulation protein YunB
MKKASHRYRRKSKGLAITKFIIFSLILFFMLGYSTYYLQTVVQPIINQTGDMKARAMLTALINDTIHSKFQQEISIDNLLTVQTNHEGAIELVQANTPAMNLLIADLSKELRSKYRSIEPERVQIPLGALLGSPILSQAGPNVNLKVIPLTVSKTDFKTEFVSEGINQTKYKVYVILTCQVQVLAPFSSETIDIEKTILVAEAVILGRVPESYVVVPGDKVIEGSGMFN